MPVYKSPINEKEYSLEVGTSVDYQGDHANAGGRGKITEIRGEGPAASIVIQLDDRMKYIILREFTSTIGRKWQATEEYNDRKAEILRKMRGDK